MIYTALKIIHMIISLLVTVNQKMINRVAPQIKTLSLLTKLTLTLPCLQLERVTALTDDSDYLKREIEQLRGDLRSLRDKNHTLVQDNIKLTEHLRDIDTSGSRSPDKYEGHRSRSMDKYDGE